jgi:hypothetical protein
MSPPGGVGAPAVLGFGSRSQGLGVQHNAAAAPGAGGVGVMPAVVALAAGHHSDGHASSRPQGERLVRVERPRGGPGHDHAAGAHCRLLAWMQC